jgi:hypothetical protein
LAADAVDPAEPVDPAAAEVDPAAAEVDPAAVVVAELAASVLLRSRTHLVRQADR